MKLARCVVLLAVVVAAAAGIPSRNTVHARAMCALIDIYAPAEPQEVGEGMGGRWQGYLEEGTVVQYFMDYELYDGGGGIGVWYGIVDPGGSPPDVYSDDGPAPVSGSFVIPSSGNYTIEAGAGSDTVNGAMVRVLVQATCQGDSVNLTCEFIATVSGPPEGGSVPADLAAGTLVSLVAENSDPTCPVEGNIHQGSCGGTLMAQARGIGTAQTTLLISDGGTYEFCIGGLPPDVDEGCWETTVTLTAYSGCQLTAGCPLMVNLPASAVVGAVVSDTRLFFEPGSAIEPELVLEAGKTAYVLGVDQTGAYYKIVWGCDYLWVPVGAMGPNPDSVWNSKPLPTGVVN